jgi:hypothetical protein
MSNAAAQQALDIGKERLRDFLESSDTGRQALRMSAREDSDNISMQTLDSRGRRKARMARKSEGGEEESEDERDL